MNSALEVHLIVIGMELELESVILINFSAFVRSFHTILIPSVLMRTINWKISTQGWQLLKEAEISQDALEVIIGHQGLLLIL